MTVRARGPLVILVIHYTEKVYREMGKSKRTKGESAEIIYSFADSINDCYYIQEL